MKSDGKEQNAPVDEARGKGKDEQNVTDYYGLNTEEKKKQRRKNIAIFVAIIVMLSITVYLLVKPMVAKWNEDVDSRISPPGQVSEPFRKPMLNDQGGAGGDRDGNGSDSNSSNGGSSDNAPKKAEDLNLPATEVGDWANAVNPADNITRNFEMVKHIQGLIDRANKELEGVEADPANPDPRLQDVANFYFWGNQQAVNALVEAQQGRFKQTPDSLHVFDNAKPNIYTFTYYLPGVDGNKGFLMAGWYDPVSDSLKVDTASLVR